MRRLIFAVLALVAPGTPAAAQEVPVARWDTRAVGTGRDLHTIHFHDASSGWAGSQDGIVYRTTDGGRSWTARPTGLYNPIVAMDWVDDRHGWAGTGDLGIAATSDGGETWEILNPGDWVGFFRDLDFRDELRGYAVGETAIFRGYLLRTADGGRTWDGLPLDYPTQESQFLRVEASSDDRTIWVLTWLYREGDGVSVSRDGGQTWTFVPIPAERLTDLAFASDDVGVAVGRLGEIFRTTDAGATWTRAVAPPGPTLYDVDFVDAQRGWAVGEAGTVLSTIDGGLTWTPEASGEQGTLEDASFVAGGEGWAAGSAGDVRHRSPSTGVRDVVDAIGLPSGEPRPPIVVNGDEGFASPLSGVRSGSGTEDDPYVISGWDVVPVGSDGITLVGTTAHVVIRDNRIHDAVGTAAAVRLVESSNVTVETNTIERVSQGVVAIAGGPLAVRSNTVDATTGEAVEANATSVLTIEANTVRTAGSYGIEVVASDAPRVDGNEVVGAHASGIRFSSAAGRPSTWALVRANRVQDAQDGIAAVGLDDATVEGNTVGLSGRHGISMQIARRTSVRGNEVFSSGQAEILSGQQNTDVTVEGNVLRPREDGILTEGDVRTVVRGNTITGGAHQAIATSGSVSPVIEANTVDGSIMAVRLTDGTSGGVVRGNTATARIWGITVEGGSPDNVVESNTVHSASTEFDSSTIHFGLNVSGASHGNVLRGNRVTAAWNGVEVWGGSTSTTVEGNTLRATFGMGIWVQQAADTSVRNNIVERATRDGIAVWTRSDRTLVEGNTVVRVDGDGAALSVTGSSDVVLRGNAIGAAAVGYRSEGSCWPDPVQCDAERNLLEANTFDAIAGTAVLVATPDAPGTTTALTVRDNVLRGTGTAFELDGARAFVASGNDLHGFAAGLTARASDVVDVRSNWWGASDGPSGLGPGSGASITADATTTVLFDPWLTSPAN